MAVHLMGLGNDDGAAQSMRAARRADPALAVPDWFPASHPLRAALEAGGTTAASRKVPEPRSGSLAFDGLGGRFRPADLPTVVQLFDESGRAIATDYLGPRDPLPAYAAVPRLRTTLVVSASASGAVAMGLLAASVASRGALFDAAADRRTDAAQLDHLRATTNLFALGGAGAVALTLGLATGAWTVGSR
jgi:hypothetical protein